MPTNLPKRRKGARVPRRRAAGERPPLTAVVSLKVKIIVLRVRRQIARLKLWLVGGPRR